MFPRVKVDVAIESWLFAVGLLEHHYAQLHRSKRCWSWRYIDELLADRNAFFFNNMPPHGAETAPVTTKDDLRLRLEQWINRAVISEPLWVKMTSGTTGPPTSVVQTADFQFDNLFLRPLRALEAIGLSAEPECVILALTDNPDCEDVMWPNPWGGAVIQICINELVQADIEKLWGIIDIVRPKLITTKPSLLSALAALDGFGFSGLPGAAVLVSGANFTSAQRLHYRALLGVPIVEAYGLTEVGLMAVSCSCGCGLKVDQDVLVEVLDSDGVPVAPGEIGQLVITSLRNRALPLIRYATGDLARLGLNNAQCDSGDAVHILELAGRELRPFRSVEGRPISAARFHALFTAFPILEFQLTQKSIDCWQLDVEVADGAVIDAQAMRLWVEQRVGTPLNILVRFCIVDTKKGKFQRYQCLVTQ
ncbi:hypothetical protein PRtIB026_A28950 [Pseudomonas sp. RtIB026]|nr:hypothetical protein PRtIB026_A28950 [Pseudomonas sp. RtIB026]